ncbi:MAG: serine/threonine protein kinase [Alphaproteobacteria bacterium]|nr:serine/threonine protein kinase [Alphaproteobacteria bacterium]
MSDILSHSPVGAVLGGRFEVTEPLAQGGMASVWQGIQRGLDRKVAIKILDADGESHDDFGKRFEREATLLAQLRHPNTVRVYDHGREGDRFFLVMELIEGETLEHVVKTEGALEPLRAIRLMRQVCAALHEAHEANLVHRDMKPSNIMLATRWKEENAVVVDFGLVKVEGSANTTRTGLRVGTPKYMAPEQINGEAVDRRTDVYALGLVLYLMLTAQRPFRGNKTAAIVGAHLKAPPMSLAENGFEGPAALEWTIARCLEKRAADRFATTEELARALNACELALCFPPLAGVALELQGGRVTMPALLAKSDLGFEGVLPPDPALLRPPPDPRRMVQLALLGVVVVAMGTVLAGALLLVVALFVGLA